MRQGGRSGFKVKKDWVYNEETYAAPFALGAGQANAQAWPLVYSQNARRVVVWGEQGVEPDWLDYAQYQSGSASPELSRQRVYAVQGIVHITPQTWALGSAFVLGMRLLHYDMVPSSGRMAAAPDYTMFNPGGAPPVTAAQFANEGYLKEWRMQEYVPAVAGIITRGRWTLPIFWQSRKGISLGNGRGLFMYFETADGSVQVNPVMYLRTLMKAPLG